MGRRSAGHRLHREIGRREKAIDGYLNDADPERAAKYGFRSGQNPRLAWAWFRDNPVGFNGVPYVLLKTIFDLDPNVSDPTLRAIARIWKREAVVPTGSGGTAWTMDHIGIGPPPSAYDNGVARASGPAQLPFGFAYENPRSFEPLSTAQNAQANTTLVAKRVFTNTSLLLAKLKTVDHEDNWEKDRQTFGTPGTIDRVFFSCAACHVGRVMVSGKMKFLPGMPNTEIEAQVLLEAADADRRRAGGVGLRRVEDHASGSGPDQTQDGRGQGPLYRDARQGLEAAGDDIRVVAGRDREGQAADHCGG